MITGFNQLCPSNRDKRQSTGAEMPKHDHQMDKNMRVRPFGLKSVIYLNKPGWHCDNIQQKRFPIIYCFCIIASIKQRGFFNRKRPNGI